MPAELFTHPRRGSRRLMSDDDDVRRARGEVSPTANLRHLLTEVSRSLVLNVDGMFLLRDLLPASSSAVQAQTQMR